MRMVQTLLVPRAIMPLVWCLGCAHSSIIDCRRFITSDLGRSQLQKPIRCDWPIRVSDRSAKSSFSGVLLASNNMRFDSNRLSVLIFNKMIAMYLTTSEFSSHSSPFAQHPQNDRYPSCWPTCARRALVSPSYRPLRGGGGGGGSELHCGPELELLWMLSLQGRFISSLASVQSSSVSEALIIFPFQRSDPSLMSGPILHDPASTAGRNPMVWSHAVYGVHSILSAICDLWVYPDEYGHEVCVCKSAIAIKAMEFRLRVASNCSPT